MANSNEDEGDRAKEDTGDETCTGETKKNEKLFDALCFDRLRTFVLFVDVVLLGSSRFGTEFEVIRKDEV